jgi:hypothetical protein
VIIQAEIGLIFASVAVVLFLQIQQFRLVKLLTRAFLTESLRRPIAEPSHPVELPNLSIPRDGAAPRVAILRPPSERSPYRSAFIDPVEPPPIKRAG